MVKNRKNENIQYVFSDVKEQEVNYINEDIQDECSNDSELTLQDKLDDYSYDMDLSFTDSSVYSDRCQSVQESTPIELSDSMYDYESKDKMELINSKKQEVQRNIKRAKNFIDSDDSDDSSVLKNTNILKSSEQLTNQSEFNYTTKKRTGARHINQDRGGQPVYPEMQQQGTFNHKANIDQMSLTIFMMSLTIFMIFLVM